MAEGVDLRGENEALRRENEALKRENAALKAQVAGLEARNRKLEERIRDLESAVRKLGAALKTNSTNPSMPPSSDLARGRVVVRRPATRTGRKRGGQAGHRGVTRTPFPSEEVARIIEWVPERRVHCQAKLRGEAVLVEAHQVAEVPPHHAFEAIEDEVEPEILEPKDGGDGGSGAPEP